MRLKVHFIGIGGVSLSCLAKYMLSLGFTVSGSDLRPSAYTDELVALGAEIKFGHSEDNVWGAQVVVYSDAVKADNPELVYARRERLYILSRAELLRSVAENFKTVVGVAGCHGKTTVTCMLAHIYAAANARFTAHIGGRDLEFSNCVLRGHDAFISEVCEYKKNLSLFPATVAVCLNADKDHMDCYKDYGELKRAYFDYLKSADKAIINIDDKTLSRYKNKNAVCFGESGKADYGVKNVARTRNGYKFEIVKNGKFLLSVTLNVGGRHNVMNALAAAVCAVEAGVKPKAVAKGLRAFKGVERRYEKIGEINGAEVIIDYAHHPREIRAAIAEAKEREEKNTIVVFQPHTFSRTIFLKKEFVAVLREIENLKIYKTFPAREEYAVGGSAKELRDETGNGEYYDDFDRLYDDLKKELKRGERLLVLGAGDLAEEFRARLRR